MKQNFAKQWSLLFVNCLIVVIFITAYTFVFAMPPAPSPTCSISGIIKAVEFEEAHDATCLKESHGCPTDRPLHFPARYLFDVSINSTSYVSGATTSITCENMYSVGKVEKIFLNNDKVKPSDTFSIGKKIDGTIVSFLGVSFDSYTLSAVPKQGYVQKLYFGSKSFLSKTHKMIYSFTNLFTKKN